MGVEAVGSGVDNVEGILRDGNRGGELSPINSVTHEIAPHPRSINLTQRVVQVLKSLTSSQNNGFPSKVSSE